VTTRLAHANIAAPDAAALAEKFHRLLGLEVAAETVVAEQGVRVLLLAAGEGRVEITEPLGPETPVGRFLAKRGPGLHHLAFGVPDIDAALARLRAAGARLIDAVPRVGAEGHRIAFVHPETFGGVLVELVEEEDHGARGDLPPAR
jgi:methylmalonyl-CoA/ethylmalonyl-CoA epimerase